MKDSNFYVPDNIDDLEELAISIVEGDVPLPKEPSQLLLEHIKKFELLKKSISDIDLPPSLTRDAQIQIAISAATDKVVVPLKRSRLFTSKTTGAIAASIALLLLISGALITTRNSSETSGENLAFVSTTLSLSSPSSEKELPLNTDAGEASEESIDSSLAQTGIDEADQHEIDLTNYETQAIELFSEILISESKNNSYEFSENLACSLEFIEEILNESINYSLWLTDDIDIENQVIVFFGTESLLLVNSTNCENNLLVTGIMP